MNKIIITTVAAALTLGTFAQNNDEMTEQRRSRERGRTHERGGPRERGEARGRGGARERGRMQANPDAKLHRFSTTIEKERPQLNQETRDLIAAYRRDPSDANRAALRKQVAKNYDAVVARKKAKLEELKRTAKHQSKVDEMQVIVDEMLRDREQRIDASMARFTDSRFRPGLRDKADAYLPVLGAKGNNVSIGRTPVTEAEWAKFTGKPVASDRARLPVSNVSAKDAKRYCAWLAKNDPAHSYRLPTEAE